MKVKITADSTCDLSRDIIDRYDITIFPLYISKGSETLKDGVEISSEDIFKYFDEKKELCKTSAVNTSDYLTVFGELLKEYDAIVHFTISSDMSCCYQNAMIAAEELGNIYPIDSRSLSTGIGHLVMDAAQMAESGASAEEIVGTVNAKKEKLDVSFIIDTLEYLKKGGRCSSVAALGANLFHLKPCIEVKNGKMGTGQKFRGSFQKCVDMYIRSKLENKDNIDYSRIFITDSGVSDEVFDTALSAVKACGQFKEIIHTRAGSTISCHCGPNCLGILFYTK